MKVKLSIVWVLIASAVVSCNQPVETKESKVEKPLKSSDESEILFNLELLLKDTVVDIDGNVYHTVQIGEQIWMVENFKCTHFQNGEKINNVTDDKEWLNLTSSAYCNYENDSSYVKTYGRMYNWYAVNDERNLCPLGWHIPSHEEWTTLINFLGGRDHAGSKMKEKTDKHWMYDFNTRSDNSSGFTGLPGGLRSEGGSFFAVKGSGLYWSATESDETSAWMIFLGSYDNDVVETMSGDKYEGYSVRCIKD